MQPIQYFAYGSNMLRARLLDRRVALLDDGRAAQIANHKLVFNKKSTDGSSKANLMPAAGETTWGILFMVNPDSFTGLDAAEGAPDHYRRATTKVQTPDGEVEAMTYLAQPDKILTVSDRPWDWYLALIIAGARACPGIPEEWIHHLRQVGQPKPYTKEPPGKSFNDAVAQLKSAGHERWRDLLVGGGQKGMKKQNHTPNRDLLAAAWQDVLARGFQTFAHYHWWTLQLQNPSFAEDTTCITVRNAALESSLMSIRDLDDFFLSKRKKPDDLIASDYGFPSGKDFLTDAEREAINKKLAHLTYRAAQELQQDPLRQNPRTWNNAEMVNRAVGRLLEFLDHLESSFFRRDAGQSDMIRTARKTIQQTLKNINSVARLEMDFKA